jgi:hypothetical protein
MNKQQRPAVLAAVNERIAAITTELETCMDREVMRALHQERETLRLARVSLATQDHMDTELEAEAVAMLRKYGLLLPAAGKAFFRKLAAYLSWFELERQLK